MSALLERSIKALSSIVNVNSGLSHPFDDARAKELFKALYAEGIPLAHSEIEALALANHWPSRHAKELAKLAERIGSGKRVMIKHPRDWGEPTVARLKAELNKS